MTLPGPGIGVTFVAPPMAGTYVAPPGPPPRSVPSLTNPPEVFGLQGLASANSVQGISLGVPNRYGPSYGAGRIPQMQSFPTAAAPPMPPAGMATMGGFSAPMAHSQYTGGYSQYTGGVPGGYFR